MSNRHLPAGQSTLPAAPAALAGDMAGEMGGAAPRRRQPHYAPHYHHQQHPQHQQHMGPVYSNYVPYPQTYYGVPPQFQNGAMPTPGYIAYQGYHAHARPAHAMHQYVPLVGVAISSGYALSPPQQHTPALSTTYRPPPAAPASIPPQTPSSTHSSHVPSQASPAQLVEQVAAPPHQPPPPLVPVAQPVVVATPPFRPPVPWLSRPDLAFPVCRPRSKRRRKPLDVDSAAVSLPVEQQQGSSSDTPASASVAQTSSQTALKYAAAPSVPAGAPAHEAEGADGTTHGGASPLARLATTAPPAVSAPAQPSPESPVAGGKAQEANEQGLAGNNKPATNGSAPALANGATESGSVPPPVAKTPVKAAPTSWAKLFANSISKDTPGAVGAVGAAVHGNGTEVSESMPSASFPKASASSLAEAIRGYRVSGSVQTSFLEPRGLINTGNMCYMNSVLQVLMFCVPFYDFLDQVSKKAAHSFKSDTPLIDAMIMFMHEYKVLTTAPSAEHLRRSLKSEEFEKYGEPFTPEFVYEAIRRLPRFASMRRGHQQDAEEFLGFLLQSLDDECTHIVNSSQVTEPETAPIDHASSQGSADASGDWLEVGRKQRAAVTRSVGPNSSTPITKMFGGLLRSEFRVPGLKDSITTEPYQPLQLDIGSPDIRNVVDALRGLTRPERLQGDFNSPRGKDAVATKQVFIESLPPVLILHLKRFQFDAEGRGTVKIWKKVEYPLELEIPREVLSRQQRHTMSDGAMPKYKLVSVVYHHGKNASGGHYTVDVRRQDGREWIRMDDTSLRRVRSDDVAEGEAEEDAGEARKGHPSADSSNRFGAMNNEDGGDDGWKQVTASASGSKRWSSVVNGTNGVGKEKQVKESIRDNKVAYLLFYQRV